MNDAVFRVSDIAMTAAIWASVLLLASATNCFLTTNQNDTNVVSLELEKYLVRLQSCNFTKKGSCLYVTDEIVHSRDIENSFIRSNAYCSSLLTSKETIINNEHSTFKIGSVFVFLPSIEELTEHVDKLLTNPLWTARTKTYFVITFQVSNVEALTSILPAVWSKKITNFVVVLVSKTYRVYTYNAYEENGSILIPKSGLFCDQHFPDKVKNLRGKPFRASINDQVPYTVKENGRFSGSELEIYKLLVDTLNATAETIEMETANSSIEALLEDKADIFLLRIFQVQYFINVDYSYPFDMVNKIIMVPKPSRIPPYMNMFYIFDNAIWMWLLVLMTVLPFVFFISDANRSPETFSDYHLVLWSILLNISTSFDHLRSKIKWLFFVWVWCSFVMSAAFQSSLLGSFLKPVFETGIKDLDDLRSSNLKVNLHPHFAADKYLSEILRLDHRYVRMELDDARKLIEQRDTSSVYLVSKEFAEYFVQKLRKENGDPTYEIIRGNLIPGVLVFHLQKHSPFLEKFDMSVLLFKQHGLLRNDGEYKSVKSQSLEEVLNISHFLIVFCLLAMGLFGGLMVLLGEIFWHRYKSSFHVVQVD